MSHTRPTDPAPSLEALRDDIDRLDSQLIDLLARRQQVVRQVLRLKREHRLPVFQADREAALIARRRRQAQEQGLSPDVVQDLFHRILRASRREQETGLGRRGVRPGAVVLLVGGDGGMGRYFRGWFDASGYRCRVLEREDWQGAADLCRGVDLALVSVPIEATVAAVRRLAPFLPPQAVLADVTSLKHEPLAAMLDAHRGPVVGLHPLFGPATATLEKQIVVATPGRDPEGCGWLLEQLRIWGCAVVEATARDHDDIMDIVQALRHFATFAFGQFLSRRGVDLARSLRFSSPIYRLELAMVGRLFDQDPALYAEIIMASPQRRALLQEYIEALAENLEMIASGDKAAFQERFRRVAAWFGGFSRQASEESSYLIDKLIERF